MKIKEGNQTTTVILTQDEHEEAILGYYRHKQGIVNFGLYVEGSKMVESGGVQFVVGDRRKEGESTDV